MEDLHILFGEVKYSVSDSEGNHVLMANVECVTGYILNGPAQVLCENPYGWPSPSKLPNCTSKGIGIVKWFYSCGLHFLYYMYIEYFFLCFFVFRCCFFICRK